MSHHHQHEHAIHYPLGLSPLLYALTGLIFLASCRLALDMGIDLSRLTTEHLATVATAWLQ